MLQKVDNIDSSTFLFELYVVSLFELLALLFILHFRLFCNKLFFIMKIKKIVKPLLGQGNGPYGPYPRIAIRLKLCQDKHSPSTSSFVILVRSISKLPCLVCGFKCMCSDF